MSLEKLGAKDISDALFLKHYNNPALDNKAVVRAIAEEVNREPGDWTPVNVKLRSTRLQNLLAMRRVAKDGSFSEIPESEMSEGALALKSAGGASTPEGQAIVADGGAARAVAPRPSPSPASASVITGDDDDGEFDEDEDGEGADEPEDDGGAAAAYGDDGVVSADISAEEAARINSEESTKVDTGIFEFHAHLFGGESETFRASNLDDAARALYARLSEYDTSKFGIYRLAGGQKQWLTGKGEIRNGETIHVSKRPTAGV